MSKKCAFVLFSAVLVLTGSTLFAAPPAGVPATLDAEFERWSEEIPGFGGMFYDAQGYPTVYLTDPLQGDVLREMSDGQVRILKGRYDFKDLNNWRGELRGLMNMPGVVLLDIDETKNTVRIGIDKTLPDRALNANRLELRLLSTNVPREAVVVEEVDPIHQLVTLRESVRPTVGGLQIAFSGFLCTLGFPAVRAGVFGFVTNSHCTAIQGGVQSTTYTQPSGGSIIATEIADPTYFTGSGCPAGRRCRRSDSSFARYSSSTLGTLGRIARTNSRGTTSGSITISTTNPRFFITSETAFPTVGQQVNKIGRTTGWTFGSVTSACVDVNVSGSNISQLCQDITTFGSGGGDSGSPVFTWSGSGNNVSLIGIMWGGGGGVSVFSAISNIEGELGALTTF